MVPFLTVGYPDLDTSLRLVNVAIDSGADIVELGIPFSDPLADGLEIQFSSQVALDNGVSLKKVFAVVGAIRRRSDIPLILMGYYNPLLVFGIHRAVSVACRQGADGFIVPDLPVEEARAFRSEVGAVDLSSTFLVAPTSSPERVEQIDKACSDFVYAVAVTGVTGTSHNFTRTTDMYLRRLKRRLSKPFVAGFGVSTADSARRMCRQADGVVIGSALIRIFRQSSDRRSGLRAVGRFLKNLRDVIQ
jgi:tryptophan synthase alpha chain